jgi:WD40 repeat protein
MRILNTQMQVVDHVAFAHDGRQLFAAGSTTHLPGYLPDKRGIDVWYIDGKPGSRLLPTKFITGLAVNPAGRFLYVGSGEVYNEAETEQSSFVVDLDSGAANRLGVNSANNFILAVHPSGQWFCTYARTGDWRTRRLTRWRQPKDGLPERAWEVPPHGTFYTERLACAPDGRIVMRDYQSGKFVSDQVFELTVRDGDNGEERDRVPIPGRTVEQLLFSPDGAFLVIRAGRSLLVWDGRDLHQKPRKIKGDSSKHFTSLAFHPSNRYLAATNNDSTVSLYDTTTWKPAQVYQWDTGRMRSVAFSPDGMLAAAGTDTGKVILWDVDL